MRRPNLFIVGAPRCGTRAMYTWLGAHPDVYMSPIKEPGWFGRDLPGERYCRDRSEYLELFEGASDERWVGEASPWYLMSATAAREIHDFDAEARVIIMLRNPVTFVESLHANALFEGDEDRADLAEALALEPERRSGRAVPESARQPHSLLYREAADFEPQVARYMEVFGPDRVHVMLLEDLVSDPPHHYAAALRFLGVDDTFRPEFEVVNANRRARSGLLRSLYLTPPDTLRRAVRRVVPRPLVKRVWTRGLWPLLHRLNTARAPRKPVRPEVRARLAHEFRPSVARLSRLLGRDLTQVWSE